MKPRTIAMISNADQCEPPLRRHRAPAQSPAPNSRALYEPPIAPSAVPIPSLHILSRATQESGVADTRMRLGAPSGVQGLSDVKKHYIKVMDTDLIERKVARDLAASTALRLQRWRLLATAGAREGAARGVRAT